LAVAHLVVPVAVTTVVAEILERVLVLAAPRGEVVEVLLLEEVAVLRGCRRRVSDETSVSSWAPRDSKTRGGF
jgi:hypothetical protein